MQTHNHRIKTFHLCFNLLFYAELLSSSFNPAWGLTKTLGLLDFVWLEYTALFLMIRMHGCGYCFSAPCVLVLTTKYRPSRSVAIGTSPFSVPSPSFWLGIWCVTQDGSRHVIHLLQPPSVEITGRSHQVQLSYLYLNHLKASCQGKVLKVVQWDLALRPLRKKIL